jgi:DGQHR domain-containing protein
LDATFPTSIVLAIDENCVDVEETDGVVKGITLRAFEGDEDLDLKPVETGRIAKVIDGQHRIAGLVASGVEMDLSVALFIGSDLSDQANIFSTVNLAQTKVNKSLAYDLFELAQVRSPQKTCHNVVVALDREKDGPLSQRIKRLGTATPGRMKETITQATLVNSLLPFLTADAERDRRQYRRGAQLKRASDPELQRMPFRNLFIDNRDFDIATILHNYFLAVAKRWPDAWEKVTPGLVLNRTNGVRALMQVLKTVYCGLHTDIPEPELFLEMFQKVPNGDEFFNKEEFLPGTSGEAKMKKYFLKCIAANS